MNPDILNFLESQQTGVIAVEMMDGAPHAATVHFAYEPKAGVFLFETYKDSRKSEPLHGRQETRASFVVGTTEQDHKTMQLDGFARLLKPDELQICKDFYLDKFPNKLKKSEDANMVFFKFTPTWWRFTSWSKTEGKKILTSDNKY